MAKQKTIKQKTETDIKPKEVKTARFTRVGNGVMSGSPTQQPKNFTTIDDVAAYREKYKIQ